MTNEAKSFAREVRRTVRVATSKPKRNYHLSKPHTNAEIKKLLKQVHAEVYKGQPNWRGVGSTIRQIKKLKGKR